MAQPQALQTARYVAPAGNDEGPNNCSNPALPCLTIQAAIGAASPEDLIYIAEGTYTGTSAEVVLIDKNLALLGGWDSGFALQSGTSTLDGQSVRRGISVQAGVTAAFDHFTVQNGYHAAQGGGIWNAGTLTLDYTNIINNVSDLMGGGIYNAAGILNISHSTIRGNLAGIPYTSSGQAGGGIRNSGGIVNINSTTLSGNRIEGIGKGSAFDTYNGSVRVNNSTISGHPGRYAIYQSSGNLKINNSTIAANQSWGLVNQGGIVLMRNSILAKNVASGSGSEDCSGLIVSEGYNLIGSAGGGCSFMASTGDQVGQSDARIDPRIAPLADSSGPTQTHALLRGSPAVNAGSPVDPGSPDPTACLAADQRGEARGAVPGDRCDIGAYEGRVALVQSIRRVSPAAVSSPSVSFTVTFTNPVTGVETTPPFADFKLTATSITGAQVLAVTGSGRTYTVQVGTGKGDGTLRLDLEDRDTILDGSGTPLGGPGVGNGSFSSGELYTLERTPEPILPFGSSWDSTPTYKWRNDVPHATKYSYQVWNGTALVYSRVVDVSKCVYSYCLDTPLTSLAGGYYRWRLRALIDGAWKPYSDYQTFRVVKAKQGWWAGFLAAFQLEPGGTQITGFSFKITCGGNTYPVAKQETIPVIDKEFSSSGTFELKGKFSSRTQASGTAKLIHHWVDECNGYVTTPLFSWLAAWQDAPAARIMLEGEGVILPETILPALPELTPHPIEP